MEYEPMLFGHQLLGDSHMVHLAMMLGYRLDWIRPRSIGLCITGQSIPELRKRLENTPFIYEKVILMIGSNDFQMGVDMKTIQMHFFDLVEYLLSRVRVLVILTIVPSPELIDGEAYRLRSMGFNRWLFYLNWWKIMNLYVGRLTVFDVSSQFFDHDGIKEEYFEQLDRFNIQEPDGLHLNDDGMKLILDKLKRSSHPWN